MFAQADGATALREDLVRALSLSIDVAEPHDWGRCCAALGGVWNGRKGYVALLVRSIDRPALRRFAFTDPLDSPEEVAAAVDEGIAFAESMGFTMDRPEFAGLPARERSERLETWNRIRKVRRSLQHIPDAAPARGPERGSVVPDPDFVARWDLEPSGAAPEGEPEPDRGRSKAKRRNVLGRLALVRRDRGAPRADAIGRLLAYF